jgi:hypothetical protein
MSVYRRAGAWARGRVLWCVIRQDLFSPALLRLERIYTTNIDRSLHHVRRRLCHGAIAGAQPASLFAAPEPRLRRVRENSQDNVQDRTLQRHERNNRLADRDSSSGHDVVRPLRSRSSIAPEASN